MWGFKKKSTFLLNSTYYMPTETLFSEFWPRLYPAVLWRILKTCPKKLKAVWTFSFKHTERSKVRRLFPVTVVCFLCSAFFHILIRVLFIILYTNWLEHWSRAPSPYHTSTFLKHFSHPSFTAVWWEISGDTVLKEFSWLKDKCFVCFVFVHLLHEAVCLNEPLRHEH